MDRDSPNCKKLHLQTAKIFLNETIVKTFNIFSSATHNVIKRLWESGKIFMCAWKRPKVSIGCLWSSVGLRQNCIKNMHESVMEITAWAQKPPSVHLAVYKFRLKLNQEKLHMKKIQKGWSTVRLIEVLNYFWKKKMDILFSSLKRKGTIRHVISSQFKRLHLWIGALHIWKGMINAKRYIQVLE